MSGQMLHPITPLRTVLEEHVEDLGSPGSCSCGWEKWDGTVEECRSAYRDHVAAYLRESVERAATLNDGVRALIDARRAALTSCCCDRTTARLVVCPVHPETRPLLP